MKKHINQSKLIQMLELADKEIKMVVIIVFLSSKSYVET